MNCKEFESIVLVLDRDEAVSGAALEHAAACSGCGEELQAIGELRASLAGLARQDAGLEAPAHIEAALLKRRRENQEPVRDGFATARTIMRARLRVALAAAAAVALMAIAASIIYTRSSVKTPTVAGNDSGQVDSRVTGTPKQGDSQPPDKVVTPLPNKGVVSPAKERRPGDDEIAKGARYNKRPPRGVQRGATGRDVADSYEIATDFFPISYGSLLQPVDSGQIVRIKLPRSALRSYGLPVDPLRADEAVKADVVIGNDGMARAIRFVH